MFPFWNDRCSVVQMLDQKIRCNGTPWIYTCVISSSTTNRKVYFQGNCTARGSRARWITGPSRRGNPCWLRRGRREGGSLWIYWISSDHLGLVHKNILEWWELGKETILTIEGLRTRWFLVLSEDKMGQQKVHKRWIGFCVTTKPLNKCVSLVIICFSVSALSVCSNLTPGEFYMFLWCSPCF